MIYELPKLLSWMCFWHVNLFEILLYFLLYVLLWFSFLFPHLFFSHSSLSVSPFFLSSSYYILYLYALKILPPHHPQSKNMMWTCFLQCLTATFWKKKGQNQTSLDKVLAYTSGAHLNSSMKFMDTLFLIWYSHTSSDTCHWFHAYVPIRSKWSLWVQSWNINHRTQRTHCSYNVYLCKWLWIKAIYNSLLFFKRD